MHYSYASLQSIAIQNFNRLHDFVIILDNEAKLHVVKTYEQKQNLDHGGYRATGWRL